MIKNVKVQGMIMAHDVGEVWHKNGDLIGYFEYDITNGVCFTSIKPTTSQLGWDWRTIRNTKECRCNEWLTEVILYAHGFYWDGEVCLGCRVIVRGLTPVNFTKGHPFRK